MHAAARMLRVYKRKDAQSSDPLAGVVDPLVSTTGSLLHTIYGTLDGLPVLGGVLKKLLPVVPDAHAQGGFKSLRCCLDASNIPLPQLLVQLLLQFLWLVTRQTQPPIRG